jgi:hypothetical protein
MPERCRSLFHRIAPITGKRGWRGVRARCISDQIRSRRIEMIRRAFRRFRKGYSPLILCRFAAQ